MELQEAPLPLFYEVTIVVLTDVIAILLTPGIFLMQIFNTNMYYKFINSFLWQKSIWMHFPSGYFFYTSRKLGEFIIHYTRME